MTHPALQNSATVSYNDASQLFPFSDRSRLLFFLKRKHGISREEFGNYWRGSHAKLFLGLEIVQKNAITYQQAPSLMNLPTEEAWDGIVLLDGNSYDDLFAVFESEEYKRVVEPDNDHFVDMAKCKMLLIGTVPLIENNTIV
ncbi:hypothetical protein H0H92_009304 [Tricholoma furcatifolium]|nr:hypothetical protein H0H92_009304 [Tricholoma furcatifolium]